MTKRSLEAFATVITRFGGKSINLFVFLIVARKLSLAEMAIYGFIFSTTLIFSTVLDLGIRNSLAVFVGKEPELTSKYTTSSFVLWCCLVPLSVLIAYVSMAVSGLSVDIGLFTPPFAVLLSSMLYLRIMQGAPLGTGNINLFNQSELASRGVLFFGTLYLLAHPGAFTLSSAIWVLAISQSAGASYLFLKQRKLIRRPSSACISTARRLVGRGFLFMLSVLLMNAAKRISFLVVSHTSSDSSAGLFFALQRLTEVITEIGMAIAIVTFSYSVRAASTKEAIEGITAMARISMFLFSIVSIAMVFTASFSVPFLLGPQFSANNELFYLLVAATLIGSLWTILFPSLSVVISPAKVFILMIPGVAINVATIQPLTARFGLQGAGWSLLISNTILTLSFLTLYRAKFGVSPREFLVIGRGDLIGVLALVNKLKSRARR